MISDDKKITCHDLPQIFENIYLSFKKKHIYRIRILSNIDDLRHISI